MQEEFFNQPVKALASSEFTAFNRKLTAAEALAQARERGVAQQIIYFYVVDDEQRLAGVVPVRRLLLAPPDARLDSIMIARVAAIPETATALEACEMFMLHKFLAFPVVSADRKLVGVVNAGMFTEQVFDVSEQEHIADVFQRIGFRVAEVQAASSWRAFRLRLPWLAATLCGGICCALLAGFYEATLAARLILAFFLTLVLGLSESVSAQSVTVTVEALHGRTAGGAWFRRAVRKELATALLLGGTCGMVACAVAWLWRGNGPAALVIGGSIAGSMLVACLIGVTVPTLLHRFQLDPRIAAGPVSLALADVFTLLVYLNLATFLP